MIAHIVLFSPKSGISAEQKRSFALLLRAASEEIGSIRRAFVGRSVELDAGHKRSLGNITYKYAAVIEFDDRSGLLEYLGHPRHAELGAMFWKISESTAIIEIEERSLLDDLDDLLV